MTEPISEDLLMRLQPETGHALPKIRQLYLNLCAAIEHGHLPFDTRLPSTRQLASELNLGRNTVMGVYEQLTAEGLLSANGRRGTRVARQVVIQNKGPVPTSTLSLRSATPRSVSCVHRELAPGEPDTSLFSQIAWRRAQAKAARMDSQELGYRARATDKVRTSIARYLATYRSLVVDPDQIVVTASTRQSLAVAAMLFSDPGDVAWVESPGYLGAVDAFRQFGLEVTACGLDEEGLVIPNSPITLPRLIYLTPCFQYPMGMPLGATRRDQLLALSRESGCVLFEDDYDSEFRDDAQPRPALAADAAGACVLHAGTFSKILFPAVRVAWLVVPPDCVYNAHQCLRSIGGGNTGIAQAAVTELLDNGAIARHLRQARQIYGQRRRALIDGLAACKEIQAVHTVTGSLNLVLHLSSSVSLKAVMDALDSAGLGAQPLERMEWHKRQPARCRALVIGLGNVDSLALPRTLKRMTKALASVSDT